MQTQKSEITSHHTASATARESGDKRSQVTISSWLLALGLLVTGLGGAFLPWIWYESVALQLTAPGLAEFVKFLPQIRTGQLEIERLFFLLPLFLAMLVLPLVAVNEALRLPTWLRWGMRLAVMPIALSSLSPVWTPAILLAREFRLQTLLAVMAVGLAIVAPLLKKLTLNVLVVLLVGGSLAAVALPLWQFSLVQVGISEAYHRPVSLGWGWWLTVAGIVMSTIGAIWNTFLAR